MQTLLLTRAHPARGSVEEMVRSVYARTYGATIDSFPSLMVAVVDAAGEPLCGAGLRTADSGFFSECYLDSPVEASIAAAAREPVDREGVLEVTTLAAVRCGLSLSLVRFVIEHGRSLGMRWGLFTATTPLRRALVRSGLGLHPLAPANARRLTDATAWGRYYETAPWVCAVADPLRLNVPRAAVPGRALLCRTEDAAVA